MATDRSQCLTCQKDKPTYTCDGCTQRFCFAHLQKHRQILNEQLDEIINDHNQFKKTILEQKQNPPNSSLLKQIDQWEKASIETIKRTAEECREVAMEQTGRVFDQTEDKLAQFTAQLKQVREENEFNEIDLQRLTNQLTETREELNQSSNIFIREETETLINKIHVVISNAMQRQESKHYKWKQQSNTVAGGNGYGQQLNQLFYPYGISVGQNKNILIADYENNRIVRWEWQTKEGTVMAGGNEWGNEMDQLDQPTDLIIDKENHSIIIADWGNRRVIRWVDQNQEILIDNIDCSRLAMDKERFLYISDQENHEVRRWKEGESEETIVAGGNGKGNQLNQLNYPTFLFIDDQQSIYVSDCDNHRVMKWPKDAEEGMIVAGGNGRGKNLNQLSCPQGLFVDRWKQIYVADWGNDRAMRWSEGEEREGKIIVGGNGYGLRSNQLNYPRGLAFDDEGNLYIADHDNHRVQKFNLILS